jgi:hypothetical protein
MENKLWSMEVEVVVKSINFKDLVLGNHKGYGNEL